MGGGGEDLTVSETVLPQNQWSQIIHRAGAFSPDLALLRSHTPAFPKELSGTSYRARSTAGAHLLSPTPAGAGNAGMTKGPD